MGQKNKASVKYLPLVRGATQSMPCRPAPSPALHAATCLSPLPTCDILCKTQYTKQREVGLQRKEPLGHPGLPRNGVGEPRSHTESKSIRGSLLTLQAESVFKKASLQDSKEFPNRIVMFCISRIHVVYNFSEKFISGGYKQCITMYALYIILVC